MTKLTGGRSEASEPYIDHQDLNDTSVSHLDKRWKKRTRVSINGLSSQFCQHAMSYMLWFSKFQRGCISIFCGIEFFFLFFLRALFPVMFLTTVTNELNHTHICRLSVSNRCPSKCPLNKVSAYKKDVNNVLTKTLGDLD